MIGTAPWLLKVNWLIPVFRCQCDNIVLFKPKSNLELMHNLIKLACQLGKIFGASIDLRDA